MTTKGEIMKTPLTVDVQICGRDDTAELKWRQHWRFDGLLEFLAVVHDVDQKRTAYGVLPEDFCFDEAALPVIRGLIEAQLAAGTNLHEYILRDR
ncbi:MAG: hypothetical protein U0990_09545 [Candidatus Nanopelagicales bacterium]|nr:hypothetical protein [Candidatus Nanopelagicales bacterium]